MGVCVCVCVCVYVCVYVYVYVLFLYVFVYVLFTAALLNLSVHAQEEQMMVVVYCVTTPIVMDPGILKRGL